MAEDRLWYLVSYDVRDEKRLRRVAKHLKGYGSRIQLSVFRCHLKRRSLERLKWELTKIMDPDDDLLIVGLCSRCSQKIGMRNSVEAWSDEGTTYKVIQVYGFQAPASFRHPTDRLTEVSLEV